MAEETVMTAQTDTDAAEGNQGQGEQAPGTGTGSSDAGEGGQPQQQPKDGGEGAPSDGEGEDQGKQGEGNGEGEDTGPPEQYEWNAPEGFEGELDQAAIEQFEPIARELGLSQEQADKLVAMHANSMQRASEQARENWTQQVEQWQSELKEDPDFGGQNFETNIKSAQKAVKEFGDPALLEALEETGMGNHPALVRTFAAIGKAISEDNVILGNQSQGQRTAEEIMYGKQR